MAAVFYKYKSSKDFHSLPIDGPYITVSEFKTLIFTSKRYGHGRDFDLLISNAKTDQEYAKDSFLIPRNSSLSIRRVPGLPCLPIVIGKPEAEKKNEPQPQQEEEDDFDSHDFGQDFSSIAINKPSTPTPSNTLCKEDKAKGLTPPRGYVCRRCKVAGHYIQHCPTNGDPSYDINVQRNSSSSSSSKGCSSSSSSSASSCVTNCDSDNNNKNCMIIIPEFYCQLCKKVMRDAAMTKCCFTSYCDNCIRSHIVSNSACVCLRKNIG